MAGPIPQVTAAARPDADEVKPGLHAWIGLGILMLLAFVSYLDRQIIALMIGPIESSLKIHDTEIGWLQGAAFAIGYPFFFIPIGYAADRYSRRWVIFWAAVFWGACAMASGLAASFGQLFLARVGVGLGEAAVGPAVAALLSEIFPKRRLATIMSIYGSGIVLGSGGALSLGNAVIEWAKAGMDVPVFGHLASWQVAFIVTGAPALLLAFLVFFVPEGARGRPKTRPAAAPWSDVFAFARLNWVFLTCYTVGQMLLYSLAVASLSWLPEIMRRTYHWTAVELGAQLALWTVLFGFFGQLANGLVVDRLFRKWDDAHMRYFVVGSLLIALSGLIAPFAPTALFYLAIMGPGKYLLNFTGVFSAALQVATPPGLRGRMTALTSVVFITIGSIAGPSMVAFFTDAVFHDKAKAVWSLAITFSICAPLAAVLLAISLKPMREAVQRERVATLAAAAAS